MKMLNVCLSIEEGKKKKNQEFLSRMFSLPVVRWRKRKEKVSRLFRFVFYTGLKVPIELLEIFKLVIIHIINRLHC